MFNPVIVGATVAYPGPRARIARTKAIPPMSACYFSNNLQNNDQLLRGLWVDEDRIVAESPRGTGRERGVGWCDEA